MKIDKIFILPLIIFTACLIGGVYGILHDQLTYRIAPEYYTKFKFIQFGMCDSPEMCAPESPRSAAAIVGFLATWWTGLPIGLVIGLVGMSIKKSKDAFIISIKALLVTIGTAFLTGIFGLIYGFTYLADKGVFWILPDNLESPDHFIAVGSMHNYSYLGGLIGMIAGVIYILRKRKKLRKTDPSQAIN